MIKKRWIVALGVVIGLLSLFSIGTLYFSLRATVGKEAYDRIHKDMTRQDIKNLFAEADAGLVQIEGGDAVFEVWQSNSEKALIGYDSRDRVISKRWEVKVPDPTLSTYERCRDVLFQRPALSDLWWKIEDWTDWEN